MPIDERLTRIDEALFAAGSPSAVSKGRAGTIDELRNALRTEVFRYFPAQAPPLAPEWGEESVVQGRKIRRVSYTTFEGLRARATYSLPASDPAPARLPAILLVDHRKGIPVWGNEQPLERNQWGQRAVLVVETLDRGSRALEQNLRSFSDDDLVHHMKRQAMVAGTTLESMQVFEILRSLELLRSLPGVDPRAITILGRGTDGVNGMYAALLDGQVQRDRRALAHAVSRSGTALSRRVAIHRRLTDGGASGTEATDVWRSARSLSGEELPDARRVFAIVGGPQGWTARSMPRTPRQSLVLMRQHQS